MTKVIILNGAPNCGKDIAAQALAECDGFAHKEFKTKLFELTKAIYSVTEDQWDQMYTRENKESGFENLDGLSPRQALIKVSEEVIKPNYGQDYFGKSAVRNLEAGQINVFSDGGFVEELVPLVEAVGLDNVLVIQINRQGCSFDGDSRDYLPDTIAVQGNPYTINKVFVNNYTTVEDYLSDVATKVTEWLS